MPVLLLIQLRLFSNVASVGASHFASCIDAGYPAQSAYAGCSCSLVSNRLASDTFLISSQYRHTCCTVLESGAGHALIWLVCALVVGQLVTRQSPSHIIKH